MASASPSWARVQQGDKLREEVPTPGVSGLGKEAAARSAETTALSALSPPSASGPRAQRAGRAAREGGQGRTCQRRKEGASLFRQLGDPTNRLCVGMLGGLTGSSRLPSSLRAGPAAGAHVSPLHGSNLIPSVMGPDIVGAVIKGTQALRPVGTQ